MNAYEMKASSRAKLICDVNAVVTDAETISLPRLGKLAKNMQLRE